MQQEPFASLDAANELSSELASVGDHSSVANTTSSGEVVPASPSSKQVQSEATSSPYVEPVNPFASIAAESNNNNNTGGGGAVSVVPSLSASASISSCQTGEVLSSSSVVPSVRTPERNTAYLHDTTTTTPIVVASNSPVPPVLTPAQQQQPYPIETGIALTHTPVSSVTTEHQILGGNMYNSEDDDNTAPSSAANTAEQLYNKNSSKSLEDDGRPASSAHPNNSIAKFIESTKRRLSTMNNNRKDSEECDDNHGALVAGYLQKLGRNGKWQTRWFETDGECLSYYKSAKRIKLLATLDLQKVGLIEVDTEDPKECSFRIQVLGRQYHLKAGTRAECKDWVIMLNRVKEARLEQGNVKLVGGAPTNRMEHLLDQKHSGSSTPRVIVLANRQRTKAVDEAEQWDQLLIREDPTDPTYISHKRRSAVTTAVVARWTKRHSSLQRLGTKLSKWARSLKKYSCAEMEHEKILLDRQIHPPGHDDTKRKSTSSPKPKPVQHRSLSTASDYDTRMIS